MSEPEDESDADVTVSVQLDGEYDDVMRRLQDPEADHDALAPLVDDVETVLETLDRMNGGTRSAIADQLPDAMHRPHDGQAVVETMQVLERYGLVELEGNTWKTS